MVRIAAFLLLLLGTSGCPSNPSEAAADATPAADDEVIVRAHMNTTGYGEVALRGSASDGFAIDPKIGGDVAAAPETQEPLPTDCLY